MAPIQTSAAKIPTILLIDSDLELQSLLSALLNIAQIKVVAPRSPKEALRKLDHQRFDCIVFDADFSKNSKTENSDQILNSILEALSDKSHPNSKTPVLTTTRRLEIEVPDIYKNKILSILQKPYDPTQLLTLIKSTLTANH